MAGDGSDRWQALEGWSAPTQEEPLHYSIDWLVDRIRAIQWPQPEDYGPPGKPSFSHRRRRRLIDWANRADEAGELPPDLAFFMLAAAIESVHDATFELVLQTEFRPQQDAWALEHGYDLNKDPLGWEELRDKPEWDVFEVQWHRLKQRNWAATFSELADPHMARLAIEDLERFDRYREFGRRRLLGELPDSFRRPKA